MNKWDFVVVQLLSRVWLFVIHGLQHARVPCSSPSPRVCSNSCPLCKWCYLNISSSVTLFSFCCHSFPASFAMNWLFVSGGQSIGASALVLPMNIQGWFPIELTSLLAVQGTLESLSLAPQLERISSSVFSLLYGPVLTSIHDYWKNHSFD